MHSTIVTDSNKIMTSRHKAVWSRSFRTVALSIVLMAGAPIASVPFVRAGTFEDLCLALTVEPQPSRSLGWLAQRIELDRQITCLHTRLDSLIESVDEANDKRQASDSASTPVLLSPRPEWLVTVHLNTAGGGETQPGSLSEESLPGDEYRDPFEEKSEPIEDPWETFNSRNFQFNLFVDRYVWKPIATGYDWIVPDPVEQAIGQAFDNVRFVPRFMNNLFQGKGTAAGIELGRFLINSTLGLAGFFDVAQAGFGIDSPRVEDTGQTLAVHGVQSGPYLVLPFLPPTTVRDGLGSLGDLVMDPLSFLLPFGPQIATRASKAVSDRSQNLDRFEGVEEATVDLYAAVRDAYQQSRTKAIRE